LRKMQQAKRGKHIILYSEQNDGFNT
jgi:hypothetical protein